MFCFSTKLPHTPCILALRGSYQSFCFLCRDQNPLLIILEEPPWLWGILPGSEMAPADPLPTILGRLRLTFAPSWVTSVSTQRAHQASWSGLPDLLSQTAPFFTSPWPLAPGPGSTHLLRALHLRKHNPRLGPLTCSATPLCLLSTARAAKTLNQSLSH